MTKITENQVKQATWVILSAVAYGRLFECALNAMCSNPLLKIERAEKLTINALKKQVDAFLFKYKGIDNILLHENKGFLDIVETVVKLLSTPEKATEFAAFVVAFDAGEVVVTDDWISTTANTPAIGENVAFKTVKSTMVGKYTKDGFKSSNGKIIDNVVGYVLLPK